MKLIRVTKVLPLHDLKSIYDSLVKQDVPVFFIRSGTDFCLCRGLDLVNDIMTANYYIGDKTDTTATADRCNAFDCPGMVSDIPDSDLLIGKRIFRQVDSLSLVKYEKA
jgi:hypothetical protein